MHVVETLKGMLSRAWMQTPKTQQEIDIAKIEKCFQTHFSPFCKESDIVRHYESKTPPCMILVKQQGTSSLFIVLNPDHTEVRSSHWSDAKNFTEICEFRLKPTSQSINTYENPRDVVDILKRSGYGPAEAAGRGFWHA